MATKRKSIIEEALLEAKSLEDALKANTKEMLAAHMKQEIENIVESSLKEEDEELEIIDVEGSGETEEGPEETDIEMLGDAGEDSEEEMEADAEMDLDGLELDLDLDALAAASDDEGEEGGVELDVVDLPMDLDMGDEEELDLTGASDDEVIAVFKKMSDEDEVEVVKDEDGIHLTDNEAGTEYYIKESEEMGDEGIHEDDELCETCGDDELSEDDIVYEIEMDDESDIEEGHQSLTDRRREMQSMLKHYGEKPDGFEDHLAHSIQGYKDREDEELGAEHGHMDEVIDLDEDELEEDHMRRHAKDGKQKYHGARRRDESKKSRKPISENRTSKNVKKVADSKIIKEYKELKSKNEQYKGALKVFKNKLNEVALFNTNLAYVNRLFTEHSTTKNEKMGILKRFDSAESIKESKTIYKSIKGELENKKPITESVENKVNKTVKSSKSDLNESTAYVDPQISAIKDLMKRIS
jgi:hypothetical protein